jgi:ADP-ribose pyrophosphatase YjhB (NUDIX family)
MVTKSPVFRFSAIIAYNALSSQASRMDGASLLNAPSIPNADSAQLIPFECDVDSYNGVVIKPQGLPNSGKIFAEKLKLSLDSWKSIGHRGVWLKLPSNKVEFASIAIDSGFVMHHAEKEYLMLTHWLSEDENKLPPSASHQVGVGSIVINNEGKLLVVQEKNGPTKGWNLFKVPTGLVDTHEELSAAACREVLEETGVETEFVGVVGFRHMHGVLFGKSDLYFLCLLKPKTTEIKIQESEIFACEWKDIDEYADQEIFKKSPLHIEMNNVIKRIAKAHPNEIDGVIKQYFLPVGFRPGSNCLYACDIIARTGTGLTTPINTVEGK